MSANFFAMHPGSKGAVDQVGSGLRRQSVGRGTGREETHGCGLARSISKKAQKQQKTASFYQEVTDAVNSKVADFMIGVHDLDDDESEMMNLRQSVDDLKRMLEDQIQQRVGIERRLEERCDRLDVEMASLKSHNMMKEVARLDDRVDAVENGFGSTTDRTTRELESVQSNFRGLKMEFDVAREAIQSYAKAVEAIEGSLRDVAYKAEGIRDLKEETSEAQKKFAAHLESSLNGVLAALHGSIVACDQSHATFRDEVGQRFDRVQEEMDTSVREALLVAKARLDQTNTRLDGCEQQCAELADKSSSNTASHGAALEAIRGDHRALGESHSNAVEGLRVAIQSLQSHSKAQQDSIDALDRRHTDVESIAREFGSYRDRVDGALQNVAQNMANELKYSRDDIEQVHGLMLSVKEAWSMKTKGLRNKRQQDNQRQPLCLLPMQFLTS